MTIDDNDLEKVVENILRDEREQIYRNWVDTADICMSTVKIKRSWLKGKSFVYMDIKEWENYKYSVMELLQALHYAYKRIELLEQGVEQEKTLSFDEYMKSQFMAYDSEEFERVRDKFEMQHKMPCQDEMDR